MSAKQVVIGIPKAFKVPYSAINYEFFRRESTLLVFPGWSIAIPKWSVLIDGTDDHMAIRMPDCGIVTYRRKR